MKYREFRLSLYLFSNHVSDFCETAYIYRGGFPIAEDSTTNLSALSIMLNKNKKNRELPEKQYGPRIAGEILHDYLENSDDALAVAYREHIAETKEEEVEDQLFRDLWPNTELGIDLKLLTRKPGRLPIGEPRDGSLVRDSEEHFTFVEGAFEEKVGTVISRNPIIYKGLYVNVHEKADGTLYPTFNRPLYTKDFGFESFCHEAAKELIIVSRLGKIAK